jgi:hypothetical protein
MINPFTEVNWRPDTAAKRKFAVSLIVGFPIIALIFLLIGRWHSGAWNVTLPLWIAVLGAGTGAVLWLLPFIARPFYVVWYGLACCIGFVLGNVLMSLFFFTVVTVTGLLLRLTGRDPLRKGFDKAAKTYWRDVPPVKDPKRYYRQF